LAGKQDGSEQGSPLDHEQLLILIEPCVNPLRQKLISLALAWMANAVQYCIEGALLGMLNEQLSFEVREHQLGSPHRVRRLRRKHDSTNQYVQD
jgi:hypothetical protein